MTWWSRLRPWGSWMNIKVSLCLSQGLAVHVCVCYRVGVAGAHCAWEL